MLKTLACKHRSTVTKLARKYKATIVTKHGPRACYEARKERPGRKPLVARFGGIPLKRQRKAVIDDRLPAPPIRRRELVTRLLRGECEWCGQRATVETHQVRKLADSPRRAGAARLGGPDGENAAQDAHRLRTLPPGHPRREAGRGLHVNIAGEPGALKGARPVRTGGRRKRTCATGTSRAAYRCYVILEAAGLRVQLVNARAIKHAPGRASSKKDAVWLAKLTEKGLLQPSFVPPYEIRRCASCTRLRADLVRDKSRYWARLEKLLERAQIKISAVLSTLDTDTARAMIEALIAGQRDPKALADLAIGKARAKRAELAAALDGRWEDHHSIQARILLDNISPLNRQIDQLTAQVSELISQIPAAWGVNADGTTGRTPGPARTPRCCPPSRSWTPSPAAASSPPRRSSPKSAWT